MRAEEAVLWVLFVWAVILLLIVCVALAVIVIGG